MHIAAYILAAILFLGSVLFPNYTVLPPIELYHITQVIDPLDSFEYVSTVTLNGRSHGKVMKGALTVYQGHPKIGFSHIKLSGTLLQQIIQLNNIRTLPKDFVSLDTYLNGFQYFAYVNAKARSKCTAINVQDADHSGLDAGLNLLAVAPFNSVIYTSFGSAFDTPISGILQGIEQVNGHATLHYVLDKASIARLAQTIDSVSIRKGSMRPWRKVSMLSADVWVEAQHHYLVKMRETGRGELQDLMMVTPFVGSFESVYEVRSSNDSVDSTLPLLCAKLVGAN